MTLHIDLTPQMEAWLDAESKRTGASPDDIARHVLEERVSAAAVPRSRFGTPEDRIRAMDALAETFRDRPVLPDDAFDRDSIYQDHV